jgi:hypothetical protein
MVQGVAGRLGLPQCPVTVAPAVPGSVVDRANSTGVIPAQAGIHPEMFRLQRLTRTTSGWAPAFAGVTPWVWRVLVTTVTQPNGKSLEC